MNYRFFILNSLKNKSEKEKLEWIEHKMSLIEKVNLWEDADKDIYLVLSGMKEDLAQK